MFSLKYSTLEILCTTELELRDVEIYSYDPLPCFNKISGKRALHIMKFSEVRVVNSLPLLVFHLEAFKKIILPITDPWMLVNVLNLRARAVSRG